AIAGVALLAVLWLVKPARLMTASSGAKKTFSSLKAPTHAAGAGGDEQPVASSDPSFDHWPFCRRPSPFSLPTATAWTTLHQRWRIMEGRGCSGSHGGIRMKSARKDVYCAPS